MKRVAVFGAVALVAAAWPAVSGQPPLRNIYVVTQAYCLAPQAPAPARRCRDQELPIGATLEVQLPGTPSVWTVWAVPPTLEATGSKKLPSPNRVEGTSEVYIFTFKAARAGTTNLVFKETPPLLSEPAFCQPQCGSFTFRVTVK